MYDHGEEADVAQPDRAPLHLPEDGEAERAVHAALLRAAARLRWAWLTPLVPRIGCIALFVHTL